MRYPFNYCIIILKIKNCGFTPYIISSIKRVFIKELKTFKYLYEHVGDQFIISILLLEPSDLGKTELGELSKNFFR